MVHREQQPSISTEDHPTEHAGGVVPLKIATVDVNLNGQYFQVLISGVNQAFQTGQPASAVRPESLIESGETQPAQKSG